MPDLEFRGVTKLYPDGTAAVRNVSFVARSGQLTAIVGPSGSGKSTLLRIAAGLEAASEGGAYRQGQDVGTLSPAARDITLLFQNESLFPHLDVLGNVDFGLRSLGLPAHQVRLRAQKSLDLMGLHGLEARSCADLSGGQRQRVALARALALEPSILLLDESFSNLDDRLRRQLRDSLRELQQKLALTILYVTHDQVEAMAVSDWMVILQDGRLMQQGTPRELYERPASEFVARFMGDAILFDVVADAQGRLSLGPLPLPDGGTLRLPGERVQVMVRPEDWQLYAAGERSGLPGRIRRWAYLGHSVEYLVDTALGDLLVLSREDLCRRTVDAPVTLGLRARGVTVLQAPV
jgi:iron(III) transport system ATP-binding protein